MGMNTALKDGTMYLPKYNWDAGMNDDLAYADRAGYNTSVEMVTSGSPHDWGDFGTLEVGPPYEMDPMGEDRSMMTFPAENAKGHIGMATTESASQQGTQRTVGGGKAVELEDPQTYNSIAISKKGY